MDLSLIAVLVIAYLLGSIPFAQIIASRVSGKDLRVVGSKNVGTRNLSRTAGLRWAGLGAMLDFGKGLLAMSIAANLTPYPWRLAAGVAAVAGHNWPIWLRFRGGKGLATAAGAATYVAFFPEMVVTIALGWLILHFTKNITATAIASFAIILFLLHLLDKPADLTWFVLGLAATVLLATVPDIFAILRGTG